MGVGSMSLPLAAGTQDILPSSDLNRVLRVYEIVSVGTLRVFSDDRSALSAGNPIVARLQAAGAAQTRPVSGGPT